MARKVKNPTNEASPLAQIQDYLEKNKGDHFNFEEERLYTISSGSLLLDIEMGGGIKPGIVRASGVAEGGKTSCALAVARNFQKMDNSMVVYVKSEGRLSADMVDRAGIDTNENFGFVEVGEMELYQIEGGRWWKAVGFLLGMLIDRFAPEDL